MSMFEYFKAVYYSDQADKLAKENELKRDIVSDTVERLANMGRGVSMENEEAVSEGEVLEHE